MSKKAWVTPEVKELSVKATEYGNSVNTVPDATIQHNGYTFYSFSS